MSISDDINLTVLEQLSQNYLAEGLPLPPPESPLVRIERGTRNSGPVYSLGFLLDRDVSMAQVLVGPSSKRIDLKHDPIESVNVENELPINSIQVIDLFHTTFELNCGLATAIQCHIRGYERFAQELLKLSLTSRLFRGGGSGVRTNGEWMSPRANVSHVEHRREHSLDEALACLTWNHWMNEMLNLASDWNYISSRFEHLLAKHPFLDDPSRKDLLVSMRLSLGKTGSAPGSFEHLIDQLVFLSPKSDANEIESDIFCKILENGFDIVPILIEHLDDTRLTHSVIYGRYNNFRNLPRKVCHVVSDILQRMSGDDLGADWLACRIGYSVEKLHAYTWWHDAIQEDESRYLSSRIIGKIDGCDKVNPIIVKVLQLRFPNSLFDLYNEIRAIHRTTFDSEVFEAILKSSNARESKINFFSQILGRQLEKPNFFALRGLLRLDRQLGEAELIRALKLDFPEAHLNRLVVETDNPAVWSAFHTAAQTAGADLRLKFMEALNYCYMQECQVRQRILFLKTFLDDSEVGSICLDACVKSVMEVRNYAARQIGSILKIEEKCPGPTHPSEEWINYRMLISKATENY